MISIIAAALSNCDGCEVNLPEVAADASSFQVIAQIAFGIIGVLAVIFVMWSGFKMITAQGDPQAIAKARQSIIYAVVGLIVALSAEVIVAFVLGNL